MSICVNAHCLLLEVLRYIALDALNTVQKIKAMSKMLKIHYTDFNALKVIYVEGVEACQRYQRLFQPSTSLTCFDIHRI